MIEPRQPDTPSPGDLRGSRVAAIDCGTNSIRLLVADVGEGGLVDLTRRMEIVRLGAGVDRTGELAPEALARTFAALHDYADEIDRLGATRVRMVATSATRDARNRDELTVGVRAILGIEPEVISGEEEAALSFAGATAGLRALAGLRATAGGHGASRGPGHGEGSGHGGSGHGDSGDSDRLGFTAAEPCLVADIGGGSTELVLGSPGSAVVAAQAGSPVAGQPGGAATDLRRGGHGDPARGLGPVDPATAGGHSTSGHQGWHPLVARGAPLVTAARSVDVGCVRLAERHLHDDPPTPAQLAAVVADAHAAFDIAEQSVPLTSAAMLVGVAGTVTTVAGIAAGLPGYDPERIHLSVTSADAVAEVTERLARMTHDERAALPIMHPGRVDVIVAGALVLRTLVQRCGVDAVVASEHDILDGIAMSLAFTPAS